MKRQLHEIKENLKSDTVKAKKRNTSKSFVAANKNRGNQLRLEENRYLAYAKEK